MKTKILILLLISATYFFSFNHSNLVIGKIIIDNQTAVILTALFSLVLLYRGFKHLEGQVIWTLLMVIGSFSATLIGWHTLFGTWPTQGWAWFISICLCVSSIFPTASLGLRYDENGD